MKHTPKKAGRSALPALNAIAAAMLVCHGTQAAQIDTGNPDLKLRWDNTFRYTAAARVKDRDPRVFGGAATDKYAAGATRDINADDGDRNFSKGLISNRLDVLSEIDLTWGDYGARVSAAAWYDDVYNRSNDNDSPATVNKLSGAYNEFNSGTRSLHGRKAEFLDAFVFGKFNAGDMPLSLRLGRYAQLYGESLFFGSNGIAAGMAPTDIIKLQSVPTATAKETTLPVGQLGAQLQISPALTLGGYYQFEWRKNRFPGVGSYFSTTDFIFPGAEMGYFGPFRIPKAADQEARNSGQFGLQLRYSPESVDATFGLYAIRYHDKSPRLYLSVAPGAAGTYREAYHEGIQAYGASFSTNVGDAAIAGEVSYRRNAALVSLSQPATAGFDNADNPGYAVGSSAHANLNVFYTLPRTSIWDGGSLLAEIAFNRRLGIDKRPVALDPNTSRDATALRVVFSPQFLNVYPGLDLSTPVGVGYGVSGKSSVVSGFSVLHGGDVSIGLNATYEQVWDMRLNYVHYLGTPGPSSINGSSTFLQPLKDRNFVSLSVQRAF